MYEEENDDDMVYVISDIDKFINSTRTIVFGCFGEADNVFDEETVDDKIAKLSETDKDELDQTLSHAECLSIVHTHVLPKKTKKGQTKYIITESQFNDIIEDFNNRLVSNLLNSMVQKGMLETAYDSEENDFIFWVPSDEKQKDQTDEK